MDGNKQVRIVLTRNLGAPTQWNEVIAGAHQLGSEARLGVNQALQVARYRQHNVLFTRAAMADGTRILSAMPRIDGDDDVTVPSFAG